MPLEGLRAWIGEVERKLGMRTRVFLVLSTIALGGAGAAIYLAIDARESSVSESDVQALQERLEAQIAAERGTSAVPAPEEPVEPETPEPAPAPQPKPDGGGAGAATPEGTESGGASAPSDADKAKLQKLLEQTRKKGEQLEEEQAAEQAGE